MDALTDASAVGKAVAKAPDPVAARTAIDAASPAQIQTAIDGILNAAPGQLDTLKELADALGGDQNFASTVTASLASATAATAAIAPTGGARAVGKNELFLNPRDFGAKGDGVTLLNAAITSGSATVTAAGAAFTAGDVGKRVVVLPAPGGTQPTLASTIAAVNSATSITLATAATYTASNLEMSYATDDTAALQAWFDSPSTAMRLLPDGIFGFTAGWSAAATTPSCVPGAPPSWWSLNCPTRRDGPPALAWFRRRSAHPSTC